jgi:ligand-binding sensor domain-containing protein
LKKLLLFSILLFLPLSNTFSIFQRFEGLEDAQIKRIVISPLNKNLFYVGSENSLFRSQDNGKTFQKVSVFKDESIKHLFFDPSLADTLYLATSRHLYKITDKIEKIFSVPEETVILNTAKYKEEIYVGTSDGLYAAAEDVLKWQKLRGLSDYVSIYSIEPAKGFLYLATSKGVYLLKDKDNIKRVFVLREKEETGEEESGLIANIIKVDIYSDNKVWLGTNRGLYTSEDGENWHKLYIKGIDNLNIYSLGQTELEKDTLYLGTAKGFFRLDLKNNTSKQIFEGIYAQEIFWVTFSSSGEIYLATLMGLFKNDYFTPSSIRISVEEFLEKEPSISEVQQQALRYNETHPDKIRDWRNALKFRALFPSLSLNYDKTIYGASSGQFAVGPRDWGVSFSWDIADLVWNPYEDDIDTRSRLNTQLRLDILDEINRVYFERLRLKRELLASSLPEEELFQKELRFRELTAIIDGYTGGYFSKRLNELNEKQ